MTSQIHRTKRLNTNSATNTSPRPHSEPTTIGAPCRAAGGRASPVATIDAAADAAHHLMRTIVEQGSSRALGERAAQLAREEVEGRSGLGLLRAGEVEAT